MQIFNYLRAQLFHSSQAAYKLAQSNPKFIAFAEKMLSAKNTAAERKMITLGASDIKTTEKRQALCKKMMKYDSFLKNLRFVRGKKERDDNNLLLRYRVSIPRLKMTCRQDSPVVTECFCLPRPKRIAWNPKPDKGLSAAERHSANAARLLENYHNVELQSSLVETDHAITVDNSPTRYFSFDTALLNYDNFIPRAKIQPATKQKPLENTHRTFSGVLLNQDNQLEVYHSLTTSQLSEVNNTPPSSYTDASDESIC